MVEESIIPLFLKNKNMACDLTTGVAVRCKNSNGGLRKVYLATYGTLGTATLGSDDEITALSGSMVWFEYDLVGVANTYSETFANDADAGTATTTQTLTIQLPKLDARTSKELKLVLWGRPHICVEDVNGNQFIVGYENGVTASIDANSGGALTDLNGYILTLTGIEKDFAKFLGSDLATVCSAGSISAVQIADS